MPLVRLRVPRCRCAVTLVCGRACLRHTNGGLKGTFRMTHPWLSPGLSHQDCAAGSRAVLLTQTRAWSLLVCRVSSGHADQRPQVNGDWVRTSYVLVAMTATSYDVPDNVIRSGRHSSRFV
jgi:hypothetical protein